jgi:drug/metabolite transporter (DMT)-like permease
MGFKYFVAPNHFLIHLKHAEGTWSKTERNTAAALIVKYNSDFKKELRILFGSSPGSPIIL